ncbi:MAG: MFS transporter [Candidatus Staskawiczbacteria bacterium]|nr:MFS transporter [Candidatus Staskawiczbacteria bacterium]
MAKIINRIVKVLITSDFFLNLGWGLLSPVFAIFILENIATQSVSEAAKVAGFAALFYWITKSFLEIPIGHFLDKKHGEKDDFWFMVTGTFITALVPIGYLFSSFPWHIYFFQVIHAVGMAMTLPSWLAIFTRHIDKGKEAFEWGIATTSIGAGAGIAGGIGGIVAGIFGFEALFIFVSIFTALSAVLLLFVKDNVFARDKDGFVIPIKSVVEP